MRQRRVIMWRLIFALTLWFVDAPARADDTERSTLSGFPPNPIYESADGEFTLRSFGRLLLDVGTTSDSEDSFNRGAGELRVFVIGLAGKIGPHLTYRFAVNTANGEFDVKDIGLQYNFEGSGSTHGNIFIGQTKVANTLQGPTSIIHNSLLERAAINGAFRIGRMTGVTVTYGGEFWGVTAGAYKDSIGPATVYEDSAYAVRGWMGGEQDATIWMLASSFRHRKANDNSDSIQYRERAYSHLAERLIDTGNIANRDQFYGAEGAFVSGPFHAAVEYARVDADLVSENDAGGSAQFHGGYVEAGLFLTNDTRTIRWDKGIWFRTHVRNPVFEGGGGAWQLMTRYDSVDLTNGAVAGGEQDNWVVGVNWYLTTHARFMLNYAHTEVRQAFNVRENGPDGRNSADSFGLRLQLDW